MSLQALPYVCFALAALAGAGLLFIVFYEP